MASFSFDVQIANIITSSGSGTTTTTKDWTGSVYQNRLNTITDAKVEYRLVKVVSGGTQSTSYVDNVSGDGNFNIIFNNVASGTYRLKITNIGGGTVESSGNIYF